MFRQSFAVIEVMKTINKGKIFHVVSHFLYQNIRLVLSFDGARTEQNSLFIQVPHKNVKGKSKVRQEPLGSGTIRGGGGGELDRNKETKTCLIFVARTH